MNLFIPLCLLCVCLAPQGGRLVEARSPPAPATPSPPAPAAASGEAEPHVKRHHRDNNIAELLIPLLERSLQEPRDSTAPHHRNKQNKKVIQVLPYRGSGEHKRKGWRKLNSHKKQVVEITPLHGKNRAKPLAYILSAAQPSRADRADNHDDSASSTLEHKYSSEEQPSSEEARHLDSDDISVNVVRADADASDSPSGSTGQSNEDTSSNEASTNLTRDTNFEASSDSKVAVTDEDITTKKPAKNRAHKLKHARSHIAAVTAEDEVTAEVTAELTAEDKAVTSESIGITSEDTAVTSEDKHVLAEVTAESAVSAEDAVTAEVTAERAVTAQDGLTAEVTAEVTAEGAVTSEVGITAEVTAEVTAERAVSVEDAVTAEVTAEHAVTSEVTVEVTAERAVSSEDVVTAEVTPEHAVTSEDDVTAEVSDERAVTSEDGVTAEVTAEQAVTAEDELTADVTAERAVTAEDAVTAEHKAVTAEVVGTTLHNKHTHSGSLGGTHEDLTEIKRLLGNLNIEAKNADDSAGAPSAFFENDIVIRHAHRAADSAENIAKVFGARARDIVELVQAPAEPRACADNDRSHDHKSYRLSFLFNKK